MSVPAPLFAHQSHKCVQSRQQEDAQRVARKITSARSDSLSFLSFASFEVTVER
jgi:hypothetical protein